MSGTVNAALITGAAGGIGQALVCAFREAGWRVIATDRPGTKNTDADFFITADLDAIATDDKARRAFAKAVVSELKSARLSALVNNAATQVLGKAENVSLDDWEKTLRTNLTAPFRLAQAFLPNLEAGSGVIVNIGSVHAQATKREFVAYATSKAALHGLTRALAVDLGSRVRVVCVAPAAVGTEMLRAGFAGNEDALKALGNAHPADRIAMPSEIARAVVAVSQEPFLFATGTTIWLDGGILSRLHDPA